MRRQSGFTIVELLIVVTILAMLAGILVPVLEEGSKTSRDARRAADLKTVKNALEAYKRQNGTYPTTNDQWQGDASNFGGLQYDGAGYIPGLVPDFMQVLPKDPDAQWPGADEGYMYRSDGTNYKFVLNKTPESFPTGNPFADPQRTDSWMVASPGGHNW